MTNQTKVLTTWFLMYILSLFAKLIYVCLYYTHFEQYSYRHCFQLQPRTNASKEEEKNLTFRSTRGNTTPEKDGERKRQRERESFALLTT
jgi:hypothetical protein